MHTLNLILPRLLFHLDSLFELFHHRTLKSPTKTRLFCVMHRRLQLAPPLSLTHASRGHPLPLPLLRQLQMILMFQTVALNLWARR
jgi:hypothetical protein